MGALRAFFKRHRLWVGFVVALIPLAVLLMLQYVWLARLEKTSAVAQQMYLENYLEAVSTKIEYHYRSAAERSLNLPASMFQTGNPEKYAYHFKKKMIEGARQVFVADFVNNPEYFTLYYYDPHSGRMAGHTTAADEDPVVRACFPMWIQYMRKAPLDTLTLTVDERDPSNRILINPITDDRLRVVGVAGFVIDEQFFKQHLLPRTIDKMMEHYFGGEKGQLVVAVRDADGRYVYASGSVEGNLAQETLPLDFVFADWTLGIQSRYLTPEQWARANFAFNVTLSGLLALVLIGGIMLAFRAASREMKLSQMKSEFVSNVSHELRTPLASIRVFAEFLRLGRAKHPDKTQEYGEYIETESRRLTQLINNILDFSRIESDRKTYALEPADLRQLVVDVLRTFDVRLKHAGFDVQLTAPASLPPVRLDRDAIAQAFSNLLDNAVKYSGPARRIQVSLSQRGGFVELAVRDFGVGISKDEQRKIFDRFHRVGTGLVHDVKGSGLGLSIVAHVVEAHQGQVQVNSEPGKGSTFTVRLPMEPAQAEAAEQGGPADLAIEPGTRQGEIS